jgi:hypothetical protein
MNYERGLIKNPFVAVAAKGFFMGDIHSDVF